MNPYSYIPALNPYVSSCGLFGNAAQCSQQMLACQAAAVRNVSANLLGIENAYPPTVHERDLWLRRDLGIPTVAEDIQ